MLISLYNYREIVGKAFITVEQKSYEKCTLVYQIDVQYEINVQVGKILKNIKRVGQNRRAGGTFFSKSINVQTEIRPCRGDFFLKINKRAGQIPL